MKTALFAHRGDSGGAPENTLAAFRRVRDTGADGVEFDVQATRDGVPVVIHDESLERTTDGRGLLQEHTLEEIRRLDAGSWRDPAFAGERVPTLAEALEVFRGTPLTVNLEVKTHILPYPGLAEAVVGEVRAQEMSGQVLLASFNHHTLLELGRLAPEIPRAVLVRSHLIEPWTYVAAHGFHALHPEHHACTETLVRGCHAAGLAVRAFAPNDEEDVRRLIGMGVDAVLTSYPARMVALRDSLE